MRILFLSMWLLGSALFLQPTARAQDVPLAKGVRGLLAKAPANIKIDGDLQEWTRAFCTPVHYNHINVADRAAQYRKYEQTNTGDGRAQAGTGSANVGEVVKRSFTAADLQKFTEIEELAVKNLKKL